MSLNRSAKSEARLPVSHAAEILFVGPGGLRRELDQLQMAGEIRRIR